MSILCEEKERDVYEKYQQNTYPCKFICKQCSNSRREGENGVSGENREAIEPQ
jgi:hypothetical protein